jgi:cyclohexanecarboxylate-CoA ligase
MSHLDLWTLVERRASDGPAACVAVDERGRSLTYLELRTRAARVAAALAERGVGAGTRVTWLLPNSLNTIVLIAALSSLGATQNPVLPLYGRRELSFICAQFEPQWLIVPSSWRGVDYRAIGRSLTDAGHRELLVIDGALPDAEPTPTSTPTAEGAATTDIRWVFYTSGTSGEPKGVRHSDASLAASASTMRDRLELTAADMWPIVFPITHVGGVGTFWAQLLAGSAAVIVEQFDPATTIELLARHPITIGTGGTALVMLYLQAQRLRRAPLFPHMRVALAGTAPKPPTLHDDVRRELGGTGIVSIYGLTEAPYTTVGRPSDEEWTLATTEGSASPGVEIVVTSDDGTPLPAGSEGEVRIRGPHVCHGYVDERLNGDAFDERGYFRSGDLGTLSEGGYLTVTGRIKDIIIRNGENISAKEVEDLLFRHPDVRDVAVFGIADPEVGERCCVALVSYSDPPLGLDDIVDYLTDGGLARYKLPERLVAVTELARNATGKVLKSDLPALLVAPENRAAPL